MLPAPTPGTRARHGKSGKSDRASSGGALLEGDVKITAYKPTNSMIIEASLKDYLSLQKVIRQLDVQRKQVYVEAIILEISQDNTKDFDISGSGGQIFEDDGNVMPLLFGVGGIGMDLTGASAVANAGGGALGFQGPLVDVPIGDADSVLGGQNFSISSFGFTLTAIQTVASVNVLSTPHILTLENEEAELQVGQRQPYRNLGGGLGSLGGLGGLGGLSGLAGGSSAARGLSGLGGLGGGGYGMGSQVQYVDVDLTLKIKPQVNASDFVRLEIDQSIDGLEGYKYDAPITSKRKISNVVVVRDGQPVVIGGLMRDQETETVDKIPFLGDIPLLGMLFRKTKTVVTKKNLLLVIVPHIIHDPSDLKQIHEQRQQEYRDFARTIAQRKKEYAGEMDYRKKNGLMQEIHVTLERARHDRELQEQSILENTDVDMVGPPETHDIEYDPYEATRESSKKPRKGKDGTRGGR